MSFRLGLRLIIAVTLAMGVVGRAEPLIAVASAATDWDVQVGSDVLDAGLTVNGFLPSALTIHVGDTVVWTQASSLVPHTVTLLDGSPRLPDFVPNPTTPGELLLGPAEDARGRQEPVTPYTGAGLVNSGDLAPPDASPFRMSFSRAGVYAYACMFHPGMNGAIQVLPETAALAETPQQATARGHAQAEAMALQLRADLQRLRQTHADVLGVTTVHAADAGLSTAAGRDNAGGMSALRVLPDGLAVHRGDMVIWTVADPLEIHTVTFTSGAPPPPVVDIRPQASGPPELALTADVAGPAGGSTYTGDGYVNSGILYPGESFALLVDAPAGTYEYVCLVHEHMQGTLSVTE
jgi:plastocyanin